MYISETAVQAALTYPALIPAIREALIDYSLGRVDQPPRTILRAKNSAGFRNGWFAVMPVINGDMMAVKTVTFFPANAELGLNTHMATVELLDRATGQLLAIMDGRLITEMRTAAVSAVAFSTLAPLHFERRPKSLGILGSGVQARAHIRALRHVWPDLEEIRVWSPNTNHAQLLATEMGAKQVPVEWASAADVVLTVTSAAEPVLAGRWLSSNSLVLAVGATGETMRELDDEVMHTSYLVGESRACVERESGDVKLSGSSVRVELGHILAGQHEAPIPTNGRILFKSVGMAIEDLTAARLVWQARQI